MPLIGLALSGGAARGIRACGCPASPSRKPDSIDFIAGTSAGALVGGTMASGMPLSEIAAWARACAGVMSDA